jgi:hypothetical protein
MRFGTLPEIGQRMAEIGHMPFLSAVGQRTAQPTREKNG